MGEQTHFTNNFNNTQAVELTGKIMVLAIIILFFVVVFVILLHLYARWFWWRMEEATSNPDQSNRRRRRRFVFAPGQDPIATLRRGLDPSVLKSLPILDYHSKDFKDGLECAVCLSELIEGEKARLLPKCNHGFHVDCIDMWFQSHSTCPLCRNSVVPEGSEPNNIPSLSENVLTTGENLDSGYVRETPNFPTNVLFWGDETQVSSGGAGLEEDPSSSQPCDPPSSSSQPSGMLVIDIPNEMSSSSLSTSATRFADDELKLPVPTRLRSLKRLLSREKRASPSSVDIEQPSRLQS